MDPLERVNLPRLMKRFRGQVEITIGLIDGPVVMDHPELRGNIREVQGKQGGACGRHKSAACQHGMFVAGILSGRRECVAPAICPECTPELAPHSLLWF